ncbi:sensor histidine kinase [Streptomyces coffeae]|uniref:histidine kinase n=1 Tax=Streptomyces coffeae TaxID=621382 RepID=A0ABS1NBR6_9ACTN|nr:histidine kinase [Streptomyces coffeae]MBL1097364.1 two-component sensor histidine kinase [Streptomyces coffeae]
MPGLLLPLARAVTYTRWLHLLMGSIVPFVCAGIYPGLTRPSPVDWGLIAVLPVPLVLAAAMLPEVRRAEGLQARLMLFPGPQARVRNDEDPGVSAVPAASWSDRARTGVWLVLRLEVGLAVVLVSGQLATLSLVFAGVPVGNPGAVEPLVRMSGAGGAYILLAPVPVVVMIAVTAGASVLMVAAARRLLGPSAKERLAKLEERTERLLERNRIARELHDSLGHALTLAVVQAGAARAAADPDVTDQALETIEETGRAALADLDRVLMVLREPGRPAATRPGLGEADRLLDSARSSGARVDAEVTGPLEDVPGPVSREGYRMLQEALTNVLRHAGPVPVRVRIAVETARLRLEVRNPLTAAATVTATGGGSGLHGIRERATLLGGKARAGRDGDQWLLHVDLPMR